MEKHPSILVIDDEQVVCDSCYRILSNEDYQVYTNTNPVEGYQKALNNNYDLLLLDLCMDKMDGIQLLKKLRHIKSDMPVMIITGYPSKETKEESTNLGVLNYISKPFQPSEIVEPINNFFEQKMRIHLLGPARILGYGLRNRGSQSLVAEPGRRGQKYIKP